MTANAAERTDATAASAAEYLSRASCAALLAADAADTDAKTESWTARIALFTRCIC
jgi:hypothetical protein